MQLASCKLKLAGNPVAIKLAVVIEFIAACKLLGVAVNLQQLASCMLYGSTVVIAVFRVYYCEVHNENTCAALYILAEHIKFTNGSINKRTVTFLSKQASNVTFKLPSLH